MLKKLEGGQSIDDITKKELLALDESSKISKLEKTIELNSKTIEKFKEREKSSARALVLYERKIRFLKKQTIDNVFQIINEVSEDIKVYDELCKHIMTNEKKDDFLSFKNNLSLALERLYDLCNYVEETAKISSDEKTFISTSKLPETSSNLNEDERFDRLKKEFEEKIGSSVLRKPGRPKKDEQSIVSELKLGKMKEETIEDEKVKKKLQTLFYDVPSSNTSTSSVPKTNDSVFDFDEALNPNMSLKDIMSDIMSDKKEEKTPFYSSDKKAVDKETRKLQIEKLESGFISLGGGFKGVKKTTTQTNSVVETKKQEKKLSFEEKYLSFQGMMDKAKK